MMIRQSTKRRPSGLPPQIPSVVACLAALLLLVPSCRHSQIQTTAHAAPPPETPAPPPTTASPGAASRSAGDPILSEDLATLNSRGYLKDAFFD
jgi:hypothetical protein